MRPQVPLILVTMVLLPGAAQAQRAGASAAPPATADAPVPFSPALAGTWRSKDDPIKLTSDFDRSVWGPDASSLRTTELVIQASGEATLTVTRRVLDGTGKPVPASTSIEHVRLRIGDARPGTATRMEHDVTIVSAERRYPEDPPSTWPLEGVRVKVVTFTDGDGRSLEVRFDTPEGKGSFWETLQRVDRSSTRAAK